MKRISFFIISFFLISPASQLHGMNSFKRQLVKTVYAQRKFSTGSGKEIIQKNIFFSTYRDREGNLHTEFSYFSAGLAVLGMAAPFAQVSGEYYWQEYKKEEARKAKLATIRENQKAK